MNDSSGGGSSNDDSNEHQHQHHGHDHGGGGGRIGHGLGVGGGLIQAGSVEAEVPAARRNAHVRMNVVDDGVRGMNASRFGLLLLTLVCMYVYGMIICLCSLFLPSLLHTYVSYICTYDTGVVK